MRLAMVVVSMTLEALGFVAMFLPSASALAVQVTSSSSSSSFNSKKTVNGDFHLEEKQIPTPEVEVVTPASLRPRKKKKKMLI